jgi:hypothetical protein
MEHSDAVKAEATMEQRIQTVKARTTMEQRKRIQTLSRRTTMEQRIQTLSEAEQQWN